MKIRVSGFTHGLDKVCDGEREVADFVIMLSHLVNNDGKIGTGASWVDRGGVGCAESKDLFGHANEDNGY